MLKRILCCLLVLVCTGGAFAAPLKKPAPAAVKSVSHWNTRDALVVPFEYDIAKDNSPAIWLRINGSKPHLFIVDTGFSLPFAVTPESAKDVTAKSSCCNWKRYLSPRTRPASRQFAGR